MMATSTRDGNGRDEEIRLWREGGGWVATHVETGVTTQGDSRTAALENLDDAVALRRGDAGREPTERNSGRRESRPNRTGPAIGTPRTA